MNEENFPMAYELLLRTLYNCQRAEYAGVDANYANKYLASRGYTNGVEFGKLYAFLWVALDYYKTSHPEKDRIDSYILRLDDVRGRNQLIQFVSECLQYVNEQ